MTIGSTNLDVWVREVGSGAALPSTTITLALAYGNQGIVPAEGVTVTATLPDKMTFVSANPAPTSIIGQTLTWNIGTLAGLSGPFMIQVNSIVAANAVPLSTLDGSFQITTTSLEMETANNTVQTHTFIGAKTYIPTVSR